MDLSPASWKRMSYQICLEKLVPQFKLLQKFTMGTSEFVSILFKEKLQCIIKAKEF